MSKNEINKNHSVEEEIIDVLDRIRPFLQRDGGDCRFIKFEDGIVYIRLYGACINCMIQDSTLYDGIEAILKEEIPEVVKVVNVENEDEKLFDDPEMDDIEDN